MKRSGGDRGRKGPTSRQRERHDERGQPGSNAGWPEGSDPSGRGLHFRLYFRRAVRWSPGAAAGMARFAQTPPADEIAYHLKKPLRTTHPRKRKAAVSVPDGRNISDERACFIASVGKRNTEGMRDAIPLSNRPRVRSAADGPDKSPVSTPPVKAEQARP